MPLMGSIVDSLTQKTKEVNVMASGLNGKAREDFCYLVTKSAMSYRKDVEHIVVSGPTNLPSTDVVVVGADEKMSTVTVPAEQMNFKGNGKIAVVMYAGESVKGVYVWTVDEQILKPKLFSRFKIDKKTGDLQISTKGIESCGENKFGVVYKDYIVRGV